MKKLFSFFAVVIYVAATSLCLTPGNLFSQSEERAPRVDRKIIVDPPVRESILPPLSSNLAGAVWYVNDTYVPADDIYTTATGNNSNTGTSASPFATINHAVSVATAGDTIYVDAGNYTLTSAIIVNKQLTFKGRQAGIDPQDVRNLRTRGVDPESVVDAVNLAGFPSTVFDIKPAASESVIDGFSIQGVNGGQGVGGIWLEAGSYGTIIQNNIIQSNHVGIFLANNSGSEQTVIRQNLLRDNTASGSGSGHAIYADQFTASTNLQNVLIEDNTFTNTSTVVNSWALGLSNTGVTAFTNITFQDNQISNYGRGMYFFGTTGSAVTGNTFDGATNYAIGLFDGSIPNATITVTGNTFTSNFRGIWVDRFSSEAYSGTLSPTGNTFTGGTYHLINSSPVFPSAIIDAVGNTYDGILLNGSTSLADIFTIADKVLDAVDVGTYGNISLRASNVYVTTNSFYVTGGTTTPSVQRGINAATAGFTVNVADGTYNEDININKALTVLGQSQSAILRGLYNAAADAVFISSSNAELRNVTVTRDYGVTITDWNNDTKNQGVNIAQTTTGIIIDNVLFHSNRNAIFCNNAQNVTITNCIIEDNRTGIHFGNNISGAEIHNNFIRNNFTHGVLFNYDLSVTITATNVQVTNNSITGNWYSQVNFQRNAGLPPTGDHTGLSFTCNWYGTASPTAVAANAAEPGYASQVPSQFGGTDPGLNRQLYGIEIALCPYIPFLVNGNDNDLVTAGFQPVPGSCVGPLTKLYVNDNSQTGDVYTTAVGSNSNNGTPADPLLTITYAISLADPGDTIYVDVGNYPENVILNKVLVLYGAKAGMDARGRVAGSPSDIIESLIDPVSGAAIDIQSNSSQIDGFAMTANLGGTQGVIWTQAAGPYIGNQIRNNYLSVIGSTGAAVWANRGMIDATFFQNELRIPSTSAQCFQTNGPQLYHGMHFLDNNLIGNAGGTGFFIDGNRNMGTSTGFANRDPLFEGNLFQNFGTGMNTGSRSIQNGHFIENTFTGSSFDGWQGGPKDSEFLRNTFTSNGRDGLVFTSFGNLDPLRGAQGTMVKNNVFSGNVQRDMFFSNQGPATHNTNSITENSFGSDTAIKNNELDGNTDIIHATCNWFGTASAAGVSAKIVNVSGGIVDYIPWLTDGTDDSIGVPGFQPVPGSCNGVLTALYVNDNSLIGDVYTTAVGNDANPGTSSAPFATIAFALSQANPADTLYVDAGNYPQTSTLSISFGLTILGSNAGIDPQRPVNGGTTQASESGAKKESTDSRGARNAEAIVDFSSFSATGTLITINSSTEVKLDGLDFKDDFPITAAGNRAIMTVIGHRNHKILNNIISRSAATEPLTGGSVSTRAIELASIGSGDSITIANNKFDGNLSAIFTNKNFRTGIYYNGGLGIVDVADNEFNYCRAAMNVDDITSGLLVAGNAFDSNGTAISIGGTVAPTGSYAFGANDFSGLGTIINCSNVAPGFYLDLTSSSYTGIAFSSLTLAQLFGIEAIMVHGTNTGRNGLVRVVENHVYVLPTTAPASLPKGGLQRGVNIALATDTVNTAAGNYTEQIEINKDLAVIGQGSGLTNVIAPASMPLFFTTSANNYPVIYAHDAVNIIVRNLTVDGAGQGSTNNRLVGVGYYQAGGFIIDLEIKAVRHSPLNGVQGGTGIFAYANTGTPRTVSVNRNTVYDFQKNGITIAGAVLTASVDSNTVSGVGPTALIAQNGIQVSDGVGSIINNNVSGIYFTPASVFACGILTFDNADTLKINRNTVANCQGSIYATNNISVISSNVISGGSFTDAIDVISFASEVTNSIVTNNAISGCAWGAYIYSDPAGSADAEIHNNSITGSSTFAIHNDGSVATVNAECNWYGTASEAGIVPQISGTVDYDPWLTNGTDDSAGVPGFQPVPNSCNGLPLITGKLDLTVNLEAYSPLPDTIIVTLRSTTTPYPVVAVDTGKLDANGEVSLNFSNVSNGPSYFIVVNHRQSIETWSATGQSFTVNAMTYDFTPAVTQAFGDNMILVGSNASIFTGDVNQDYIVDLNDLGIIDNDVLNIALGPYLLTDLNGDGITDINDMAYADNNAFNIVQKEQPSLRPGERISTNKKDIFLPTEKEKAKTFTRQANRDM